MAGIFINVRVDDGQDRTWGLDRSLSHVFGKDRVFRSGGSVRDASVMVVLIGPGWLDDLGDGARQEIAEAFRLGKRIVPVLTGDADLPDDLPSEIAGLSRLRHRRIGLRTAEQDIASLISELIRLAPELGIGVLKGLEDLSAWLDSWRHATDPVLPASLPVLGRDREVDRLCAWLDAAPSVLSVYADGRTEAAAFVATALAAHRPGLRAVHVSSQDGWRHCQNLAAPYVAVVDGPAVDVKPAEGHVVVVRSTPDRTGGDLLVLPRIPRDKAAETFAAAGVPPADANSYADVARRSVSSLRRRLSVSSDLPKWANPLERDLAAPLLLIGRWSADSSHDRDEIAAIAGRETDELDRFFDRSEGGDDPLLIRSGDRWQLADPQDAWSLLSGRLTAQDLRRWHEEAVKILAEPETARTWSPELRRGLAQGAALLASMGETTLAGGVTCADHAAHLVRDLLGQANDESNGLLWRSLADVLPLLAEAAPHEFLGAIDRALTNEPLRNTFDDGDPRGLLAALESVSWLDDALPMVVSVLAELARLDTAGQPIESLITLLQPWYPYLDLPSGQRTAFVKAIDRRTPEVGWRLTLALLGGSQGHLLASPQRPQVRLEWTIPSPPVAVPDLLAFQDELVTSALTALENSPQRWCEFFEQRLELTVAQWDRVVEDLTRLDTEQLSADELFRLWDRLTRLTAEHRHYAGAGWALPEELLQWLESCAEMIEPAVNPRRHALLFGRNPYLDNGDTLDPEAREAEVDRLRRDAVSGVLREHGVAGLGALAAESALPRLVGATAAEVAGEDIQEDALAVLGQDEWASGWAGEMTRSQSEDWWQEVATQLKGQDGFVDFLLAAPAEHAWALLDSADDAVHEAYWTRVAASPLPEGQELSFITQLLARRRPWAAVEALALGLRAPEPLSPPASLVEDVLLRASEDGIEPPDRRVVSQVGPLLDHLVETGGSDVAVARLELRHHASLKHQRKPRSLHRILAEKPVAFVDLYTRIHPTDDAAPRVELVNAWFAIFELGTVPGHTDAAALKSWVSSARAEFAERGRSESGDRAIGTVLAGSPVRPDSNWPPEPVRDVLDVADGGHLREGFAIGMSVQDGDLRDLAQRHRAWARQSNVGWPRVAALLRDHADHLTRHGQDAL